VVFISVYIYWVLIFSAMESLCTSKKKREPSYMIFLILWLCRLFFLIFNFYNFIVLVTNFCCHKKNGKPQTWYFPFYNSVGYLFLNLQIPFFASNHGISQLNQYLLLTIPYFLFLRTILESIPQHQWLH
jgi:hypothetical protein